jgi:hypothetical protein
MSFSKRILFGNDPQDDDIRRELAEITTQKLIPYVHKIGLRRRNKLGQKPHWDPFWESCLISAAKELDKEYVLINSKICFLARTDAEEVKDRADELHKQRIVMHLKMAHAQHR